MTGRAILRLSPIALLVVVAACGGGGKKLVTSTTTTTHGSARVYLLRDGKVAPVARSLPGLVPSAVANVLNQGPTPAERAIGLRTAFPGGPDFEAGGPEALAQMVYTLTQDHPAARVRLGRKSYTRADFEDETPIILVENPLPFAHVKSPIHATGTANTFEATFQYELKDAAGKILAKHFVMATSGSGVRGTFDVKIPFTITRETAATLTVYEDSAANGKRIHESEIPLTLEP